MIGQHLKKYWNWSFHHNFCNTNATSFTVFFDGSKTVNIQVSLLMLCNWRIYRKITL